jgi:cell division protein FtsZ
MEFERAKTSIIKVVGIGGGGCNAVNYMHSQGIQGVDFVVCNTDVQSLEASPVLNKIQLGKNLTDGLGAGNDPESGRNAALESIDDIKEMFDCNTKMVFLTAGMGGGTGTGAAPVIASIAREMDILTVGIVTEPFSFEGIKRKKQAEDGINELRNHVDSLIVICNDKLRQLYGNLKLKEAFTKADNVLSTAAKGIAEIITVPGYVNMDFKDVRTVMKDSGVAIMGVGIAEGENRALKAAELALNSPLLNDNNIKGAQNILVHITSGADEIDLDELGIITDYIQEEAGKRSNIIWGNYVDESLGSKVSVNVVATGFQQSGQQILAGSVLIGEQQSTIHKLQPKEKKETEDHKETDPMLNFEVQKKTDTEEPKTNPETQTQEPSVRYDLYNDELPENNTEPDKEKKADNVFEFPSSFSEDSKPEEQTSLDFELKTVSPNKQEDPCNDDHIHHLCTRQDRINNLKSMSMQIRSSEGLNKLEKEPAFRRKEIEITPTLPSNETDWSDTTISNSSGNTQINKGNSFLHDNVD